MQAYRIRRDGQQYLVFSGRLVAEASDRLRHGTAQDRWTDIRVYRTATGSYVVEQVMRTLWQKGEGVWYKGGSVHHAAGGLQCVGRLGSRSPRRRLGKGPPEPACRAGRALYRGDEGTGWLTRLARAGLWPRIPARPTASDAPSISAVLC
jgi:hypothetical protein